MCGQLVHCLDVDSTVPVLVSVGLIFHDVQLGLWRAFHSISAWVPRLLALALWSGCPIMQKNRCVTPVASTTNETPTVFGRSAGSVVASLPLASAVAPGFPCEGAP